MNITKESIKETIKKSAQTVVDISKKAYNFVSLHKTEIAVAVPMTLSVVKSVTKSIETFNKCRDEHLNAVWHEKHIYDPALGVYVELKRPLRNYEIIELNNYRREGYSVTESLVKLKVVK